MPDIGELIREYQPGTVSIQDVRIELTKDGILRSYERKRVMQVLQNVHVGVKFFRKLRAERNGKLSLAIPEEESWRDLLLLDPREQAKWYLKNCPEVGTLEYNIFKRLCKAFGIGGNEFYYWLRKLS